MKIWIFLLVFIVSLAQAQTLKIATTADNPPFSTKADQKNHFYGFDLDIMEEVCKRIGVTCKYSSMLFDNLFPALDSNQIDIAIASIVITPTRQENFLLSLPYLASHVQFIANQESAINSPDDIKNKRVGVRQGTPFKHVVDMLYSAHQVTIIEYPFVPNLLEALSNKKVDVILMDKDSAQYWYANNSNLYKLVGPPIPFGGGYGIMARKGSDDLILKINAAILQMESDGTYLKIYTRYFN